MFLIVNDRKLIMHISSIATRLENGHIRVSESLILGMPEWDIIEVESVPNYVIEDKYFYENGTYVENPNYIDYKKLEAEQLSLTKATERLEVCITELTNLIL